MNNDVRGWLRASTVTAATVAVAALMVPGAAHASPGSPAPVAKAGECSLAGATITAEVSINDELTERFETYANSGGEWTGADSTYSLPLPGGETGWFFSDTFLGEVNDDGSRPLDSVFVNNSIVVDDGETLRTVTGGTPEAPESVIPPTEDGKWHWIGDPTAGRRGTVHVPLLQFEKFGPGGFDFGWTANRLAILDEDTLELQSIEELPSATGINWGSWTQEAGNRTLVYGITDIDGVRSAFVARTSGTRGLDGIWRFWDGQRWSPREADAAPVASYVANEFSVAPFRDGWLMVTHDTTFPFDNRIVAKVACEPTGPFVDAGELYRTPETGPFGSYGDGDVFTYNAHEHPEFREGDTLLVTYNVNTFDNVGDVYDDASIYRPRFLDVSLTVD